MRELIEMVLRAQNLWTAVVKRYVEERYRLMIGRCIERREPFGVVLIRDGRESGVLTNKIAASLLVVLGLGLSAAATSAATITSW